MEKLQETVEQNVQNELKHYQGTTKKKLKTLKQLNELRENLNKLQNEIKRTIKRRHME
jgi:uncharacterized protein YlxW (UPF0749 family)